MVFQDKISADKSWVFIGNSDIKPGGVGSGDNQQISFYRSKELYGPWGPEQVSIFIRTQNVDSTSTPNTAVSFSASQRSVVSEFGFFLFAGTHHGRTDKSAAGDECVAESSHPRAAKSAPAGEMTHLPLLCFRNKQTET